MSNQTPQTPRCLVKDQKSNQFLAGIMRDGTATLEHLQHTGDNPTHVAWETDRAWGCITGRRGHVTSAEGHFSWHPLVTVSVCGVDALKAMAVFCQTRLNVTIAMFDRAILRHGTTMSVPVTQILLALATELDSGTGFRVRASLVVPPSSRSIA